MKRDHHDTPGAVKDVMDDETKKVHWKSLKKPYLDTNKEVGVEDKPKESVEVHEAPSDGNKCVVHD